MLDIKNFKKSYNKYVALENINLSIPTNGIVALVGDNGVGKTTLINSVLGYINYDSGEILLNNIPIKENIEDASKVFFMPDLINLNLKITVFEYAQYIAILKKENKKVVLSKLTEVIKKLNFDFIDNKKKISKMSSGQKKKIFLALFLALDIKFLVLDEPTANLDVRTKNEFIEILKLLNKKGIGILITSHIIEEIQQIADYLVIINDKKVVYSSKFDNNIEKISEIYEKNVKRKYLSMTDVDAMLKK